MADQNEILHSENRNPLTAEQIAKAQARHNKNHSPDKSKNADIKANKPAKK